MGSGASIKLQAAYEKEAIELVSDQNIRREIQPHRSNAKFRKQKAISAPKVKVAPEPVEDLEPEVLTEHVSARNMQDSTENADTGRFCKLSIDDRIMLQYEQREMWSQLSSNETQ